MPALVESMFSAREVPWHGLGTQVSDVLTAAEAITTGGLDWRVDMRPIFTLADDDRKVLIPEKMAVVRDTDKSVLGVVGKNYVPFQNVEAFEFFDNLVDSGEAKYETAGSLRDGRWVWLTAKVPSHIEIGGIDPVEMYLLLSTSHDGTKSIQVSVTPVRVVCMNTLNLALSTATRRWSVRHLSNAANRLQEARDTIGLTFTYMDTFQMEAEALLSQKFSDREMSSMLDELLPDLPRTDQVKEIIVATFKESPTLETVRGTKWAALNAVGEYYDWIRAPRSAQSQVLGTWTGIARTQRDKAMALLS